MGVRRALWLVLQRKGHLAQTLVGDEGMALKMGISYCGIRNGVMTWK